MARNFRSAFRWLLPSWLTADEGGLVAFSLATMKDIYLERVRQGLIARFPRFAQDDALAVIGRERGLLRGRSGRDRHVERLQQWRQAHRRRGSAWAALGQISEYFGGGLNLRTIDVKGNEHTLDADGATAYTYNRPWRWVPADTAPTPALDADAGSDTYQILVAGTGTLTLHCDGSTPGDLVLVQVSAGGIGAAPFAFPDGWTRLLSHEQAGTATTVGQNYHQEIWQRIARLGDTFDSVTITCTNTGTPASLQRFIGRAINVPGPFSDESAFSIAHSETAELAAGNSLLPTSPHASDGARAEAVTQFIFLAGRLMTYQPHSGSDFTELGAERIAGTTGIGIAAFYRKPAPVTDLTLASGAGSFDTGSASVMLAAAVSVVRQPTPKARFWVELLDAASDIGITANAYSATAGPYWQSATAETVGMIGTTPAEMQDIRNLFQAAPKWKPAGSRAEWLILNLTGAAYEPDGTWEYWSVSVDYGGGSFARIPSRASYLRFVDLRSRAYAERDLWSDFAAQLGQSPDTGPWFAGSADGTTAWSAQPLLTEYDAAGATSSPGTYAGATDNAAAWSACKLPDDGDIALPLVRS